MKMIKNKFLYLNILISLVVFIIIVYSNLGKSGGDIAIVLLNLIFGIIQFLFVFIYGLIKKNINGKILLLIVMCQFIECIILINFGKDINKYYKINFLKNEIVLSANYHHHVNDGVMFQKSNFPVL